VIDEVVFAALGGTFSDDPNAPRITITIAPGALSDDARLRVRLIAPQGQLVPKQTRASRNYEMRLQREGRGPGALRLSGPMKIALAVDAPPVHPQVPEVAFLFQDHWVRLSASFFRHSSHTVVALTEKTEGVFGAIHRRLRTERGEPVQRGERLFMQETFGDQRFFGGVLGLHKVLNKVAPVDAVALGVQVDVARVPQPIVDTLTGDDFDAKQAALHSPAVTRALIKAGAVVGVKGFYADPDTKRMRSVGLTCALCHVTVEPTPFQLSADGDPVMLPIGPLRLDGVPNTAMNAGAILALTPTAQALGLADTLNGWGPGRFDVRALDVPGVDRNPLEDGVDNPTEYPPLWNFVDLSAQQYRIGWDGLFKDDGTRNHALASLTEAVFDLVFHSNGAFGIPPFRIDGGNGGTLPPELSVVPPPALVAGLIESEIERPGNRVVPPRKLLDLEAWMRSIASPAPDPADFDETLAERGFELFHGEAACSRCHRSPEFTGPGLHVITATPPAGGLAAGIKVAPLRGIGKTAPYFHDGSAPDLAAVVRRYVDRGAPVPALSDEDQAAIVEYLKSL